MKRGHVAYFEVNLWLCTRVKRVADQHFASWPAAWPCTAAVKVRKGVTRISGGKRACCCPIGAFPADGRSPWNVPGKRWVILSVAVCGGRTERPPIGHDGQRWLGRLRRCAVCRPSASFLHRGTHTHTHIKPHGESHVLRVKPRLFRMHLQLLKSVSTR